VNRIFGIAATLLVVPAVAATMATSAAASGSALAIARPGTYWTVNTAHGGCENVHLESGHKFVADEQGDKGTWQEPTQSTITMNWTGGSDRGTALKGTFKVSSGRYKGTIHFPGVAPYAATVTPGTASGC
jgi:hypothetical protein